MVEKKSSFPLTQERVRELFDYCEETGVLTRKSHTTNRVKVGSVAGTPTPKGYHQVMVDCKLYLLHRIIFLYIHGYMPENQVDHISRNKTDNRPCNLREVSHSCNQRNAGVRESNTSGIKGVYWHTRDACWVANISINSKSKPLGYHKDFTEAVCHRYAAETCLQWNDCDANSSAYQYLKQQGILKC